MGNTSQQDLELLSYEESNLQDLLLIELQYDQYVSILLYNVLFLWKTSTATLPGKFTLSQKLIVSPARRVCGDGKAMVPSRPFAKI